MRKEKKEGEDKKRKMGRKNEVKKIRKRRNMEDRIGTTAVMGRNLEEVNVIKGAVPSLNEGSLAVTCSVCLESFIETKKNGGGMLSTVCGHVFCALCLPKVIGHSGNCPKCRKCSMSYGTWDSFLYHPMFLE